MTQDMKLNLATQKILIIEDYPAMRKAIKDMLYTLDAHYIVDTDNAVNALKIMSKQTFDIVLSDYNLGDGKNGQQILEEARFRNYLPFNSIFIIVTCEQTPSMVLGAMDNKPDEYLTKPFNAHQLNSRLQKSYFRKEYLLNIEREIQRGNLALAIHYCDKLLHEKNKRMHTLLLKIRAELALETGDLSTASDIYRDILLNRDLPWARLGQGIIAFRQDNTEQAIEIFENLVSKNPLFMESYDWLSLAYQAAGLPIKAQEILNQAVEISPSSILRQKKLASTADQNNNVEIAEHAYKAVVKLGKHSIHKSSRDYSGLAKLYSRTHNEKQALKILDDMRQEYVNDPEAELRAATLESELYSQLGEEKLARQAFEKIQTSIEDLGKNTPKDLQLDLAKACFLHDKTDTANKILDSLIKTHIDDEGFIDEIRNMQSGIGMENHSESLIQKTKQELIDINNRGVALFKQEKISEAMELFEHAFTKMPNNKTIILNMVKIALHDLKISGLNEDKILRTQTFIQKAKQIGVPQDKLSQIQMEFARLTHARPVKSKSHAA